MVLYNTTVHCSILRYYLSFSNYVIVFLNRYEFPLHLRRIHRVKRLYTVLMATVCWQSHWVHHPSLMVGSALAPHRLHLVQKKDFYKTLTALNALNASFRLLKTYNRHYRVCVTETIAFPRWLPQFLSICAVLLNWMRIERVQGASEHGSLGPKTGPRRPFKFSHFALAR